jgi:hypothetical protein
LGGGGGGKGFQFLRAIREKGEKEKAGEQRALARFNMVSRCHSERSEESRIFNGLRSFTAFRMTN